MTIALEDLTVRFGEIVALDGVSAKTHSGRIIVVIGPNASGKSTLLRSCIGAVPPQKGRVLIDGDLAHRLPAKRLAQRVAYVPQRPTVAAAFTVREVIELGRYALPAESSRIDDAIERLDLVSIVDRPFHNLSVGQQQRVALGRALAQLEPGGHLVLDEPTSAMDIRHMCRCFEILRAHREQGSTILVALHDLQAASQIADEAWLMHDGRLVASGRASDVLTPERLSPAFGSSFEVLRRQSGREVLFVPMIPAASDLR